MERGTPLHSFPRADPGDHITLSIKAGEPHTVSLLYLELKQGFW